MRRNAEEDAVAVEIDAQARLRQVEDHVARQLERREVTPQQVVPPDSLRDGGRPPIVPQPRRARVYLLGGPAHGHFATATVTHPVKTLRRGAGTVRSLTL